MTITYYIKGIPVCIEGEMTLEEANQYLENALAQENSRKRLLMLNLKVDGEYVEIESRYESTPFLRIRRITGYLVGSLTRFNDAKLAEVRDRNKHSV